MTETYQSILAKKMDAKDIAEMQDIIRKIKLRSNLLLTLGLIFLGAYVFTILPNKHLVMMVPDPLVPVVLLGGLLPSSLVIVAGMNGIRDPDSLRKKSDPDLTRRFRSAVETEIKAKSIEAYTLFIQYQVRMSREQMALENYCVMVLLAKEIIHEIEEDAPFDLVNSNNTPPYLILENFMAHHPTN
ncbi:hypothetical protein [Acetobacter malorum]|uniref:hypothetical protein n=1 Tax=Acetobacter malorum TaxID=178901 RepID=UPI0007778B9E|nr:hypothetical protein [Acetobacter malorum]KXV05661.1 hypothetical protein AD930_11030 [Acetobacter malorum]